MNLIITSPVLHLVSESIGDNKHTYLVNEAQDCMFTALTHAIRYSPRGIPKPICNNDGVSITNRC